VQAKDTHCQVHLEHPNPFKQRKDTSIRRLIYSLSVYWLTAAAALAAGATAVPNWEARMQQGVTFYDQNKLTEAETVFLQLMNEGVKRYGAHDGRLGRVYTNLGEVYAAQGKRSYARAFFSRALTVNQKAFGENSPQVVSTLNNIGQLYVKNRQYAHAEPQLRKALAIAQKLGDAGKPYAAVTSVNIGAMYVDQRKYANALPWLKSGSERFEALRGPNDPLYINSLRLYADVLRKTGHKAQAEALEKQSIARARTAQQTLLPWEQSYRAARDLQQENKSQAAEAQYKKALLEAEKYVQDRMPLAITLSALGKIYVRNGKPIEALETMKRALPLADKLFGADDPQVLKLVVELADLDVSQGHYAEAEPLYIRVLSSKEKDFGLQGEQLIPVLTKLGNLYRTQALYAKAAPVHERALTLRRKNAGGKEADLVELLALVADDYRDAKQYADAERLYKESAALAQKQGPLSLAPVLDRYNVLFQKRKEYDQSEALFNQCVQIRQKELGAGHPEVISTLERQSVMFRQANMRDKAKLIDEQIAKLKADNGGR
jgi:Flp pilus assembly protein TadD